MKEHNTTDYTDSIEGIDLCHLWLRGRSTVVVLRPSKPSTRVRFPSPALTSLISSLCAVSVSLGCAASVPMAPVMPPQAIPPLRGSYYDVQPGETLWRIARDFGLDAQALARVNHLPDAAQVKVGQRLFIPAPAVATDRFLWPVRGQTSRLNRAAASGIEIRAPEGSVVRASRAGRVAVAARQVQGFGKTVVLDHGDGYLSIYAGLDQLLVAPGLRVEQGNPVGRLGRDPLYFEIRRHAQLHDPLRALP